MHVQRPRQIRPHSQGRDVGQLDPPWREVIMPPPSPAASRPTPRYASSAASKRPVLDGENALRRRDRIQHPSVRPHAIGAEGSRSQSSAMKSVVMAYP